MALDFENAKCCKCGALATAATRAAIEVPSTDNWRRYEPDPEGPQFWCDDHEPGRKPTCSTCFYWRDKRCTNATILDFVKNDPHAISETPPDFSCHLHLRKTGRQQIEVTNLSDVDEHGNIKRRFEEVG